MAKPDRNQFARRLPLISGSAIGVLLLVNRLLTPALTESQARSDALGVLACALLILTGLLWQRIQPKPPEAVELSGEEGFDLDGDLDEVVKAELAWASHLLLTNTATKSIVAWKQGRVLLRRGIIPSDRPPVNPGAIVQRVLDTQKPTYLVNLKLYPGRVEFDYLPGNTQGIICQPMGDGGVLILGANAPRSYTKQDENWIEGIANKLGYTLDRALSLPR